MIVPRGNYVIVDTPGFIDMCRQASEGTTNRVRLKEDRFLQMRVALPSRGEQNRIVEKIEYLVSKMEEARENVLQIKREAEAMLQSAFAEVVAGAPLRRMLDVCPLVRRPVEPKMGEHFPELGIRSFGKGTFHKPALDYLAVGSKKIYLIEPGDLLLSNVFAREGAIAVAKPWDAGRFGSHRFVTCVPKPGVTTSEFLCFYLLTKEGLQKISEASPGGAGRNRTLGLTKLAMLEVPIPEYDMQRWFNRLQAKVAQMLVGLQAAESELDSLLPSVLDVAFGRVSSSGVKASP